MSDKPKFYTKEQLLKRIPQGLVVIPEEWKKDDGPAEFETVIGYIRRMKVLVSDIVWEDGKIYYKFSDGAVLVQEQKGNLNVQGSDTRSKKASNEETS